MDQASLMVNTIVLRLGPWYSIEFQLISDLAVRALIGKHYVEFGYEDDEPFPRLRCDPLDGETTDEATNFVNHINGILAGKVRNDAGELVSA